MASGWSSTTGGDGGENTSNGQQGDTMGENQVAYSSVAPPFRRWKSSDSASTLVSSSALRNKSPIPPSVDGEQPATMELQKKKSVRWGANTEHHDKVGVMSMLLPMPLNVYCDSSSKDSRSNSIIGTQSSIIHIFRLLAANKRDWRNK